MDSKLFYLFFFSAILGLSQCQQLNDINEDDIKNKLGDAGIDTSNLPNFNASDIPVEQIKKSLQEKCAEAGADPSAVDDIQNQKDALQECLQAQVNVTLLQEEIEESKKTGSMDEVFGKYCKKYPDIYGCFDKVTEIAKQCMTDGEKKSLNLTMNIVKELKEFVCYKDGDRIAMFVAEGGVECIKTRQEGIQKCLNETFGAKAKVPEDLNSFQIPEIVFTDETCGQFETIRDCVVEELEKCKDSTPANIMDALFKFLRKMLPCKQVAEQDAQVKKSTSGATLFYSSIFLVLAALGFSLHQ